VWLLARDLVNEPANVLYPEEFARRATELKKVGVAVEVLDVAAMKKLGMKALLGVGQGSVFESRTVIMRWNGGRRAPADCLYRQGRVLRYRWRLDQAGERHGGHEGRHGRRRLRGRADACACRAQGQSECRGAIGIVENAVDGKAQRPGDIVTTMSGQTIEIINTDAEGRLYSPTCCITSIRAANRNSLIDLATLTGAIIVALGNEYAGMFANDDKLAERLTSAGKATGERVWRMPLGPIRQEDRFEIRRHERTPAAATAARSRQRNCSRASSTRRRGRISTSPAPAWARRRRHQQKLGLGLGRAAARPPGGGEYYEK